MRHSQKRLPVLAIGASAVALAVAVLWDPGHAAVQAPSAPSGKRPPSMRTEQNVVQQTAPRRRDPHRDHGVKQRATPRERGPAHEHGAEPKRDAEGVHVHGEEAEKLLDVPITTLFPGNKPVRPDIENPVAGDPEAIRRGMRHFITFNCVGCHAPNGGGGMGPALSNSVFLYGGEPANILLSIHQGRPNGMPVWAPMMSHEMLWDLVAYIESISKEPSTTWGKTISAETMKIEQVPAEYVETTTPWKETEPFGNGQKPKRGR